MLNYADYFTEVKMTRLCVIHHTYMFQRAERCWNCMVEITLRNQQVAGGSCEDIQIYIVDAEL